ncbi:hypothetical protein N9Y64_04040, partial [Alphaproteobacteria bacterium]|nr:hypothetical protein [Alphaproteobacteria bacterium]
GIGWQNGARKLRLDGANGKLDDIAHILPQLWLTPAMDRLFVDGASGRRKFLDRFAQSLDATLSKALGGYEKAMRERNRLLQEGVPNAASNGWLDGLEEAMALHGVAIAAARLTALDALAVGLAAIPETAFPRAEIALADCGINRRLRSRTRFAPVWHRRGALMARPDAHWKARIAAICRSSMRRKTWPRLIARPANKKRFWSA